MKRAAAVLMLIAAGHAMWAASSARAQETSLAALSVNVVEATTAGPIKVELRNNAKGPMRIFRDSNTWGAARWRLLKLTGGGVAALAQTAEKMYFTRNIPAFDEIPAGGRLEVRLDLTDGNWLTSGATPSRFQAGDTIVAIYDVPSTTEGEKLGVWHGIAVAVSTVR